MSTDMEFFSQVELVMRYPNSPFILVVANNGSWNIFWSPLSYKVKDAN
jgi:hypothetical protein